MNSIEITNIMELRMEIERLRLRSEEQSNALAERFRSPSAIFYTVRTLFQKKEKGDENNAPHDFFSLASRFLIPFTLNKTLFRHSNFVIKMLVGVVSQKAAGYINEGTAEKIFAEGKAIFNKFFHKSGPENLPAKSEESINKLDSSGETQS